LNSIHVIINLCGEGIADKRWSQHREKELSESRLEPTKALVQSVLNMKTKPDVFYSGISCWVLWDAR